MHEHVYMMYSMMLTYPCELQNINQLFSPLPKLIYEADELIENGSCLEKS